MRTIWKQELFPFIKEFRYKGIDVKKEIQFIILAKIKWKPGLTIPQADKISLDTYAKLILAYFMNVSKIKRRSFLVSTSDNHK